MAQTLREVMTPNPVVLPANTPLEEAAKTMKERDIGDVLVSQPDGSVCGMVTDRDMVVRGLAEGRANARLDDICTRDLAALSPDDTVEDAVQLMKDKAIRRIPVLDNGNPVGMVSIGDLAIESFGESALADISAAPPNN